MTVGARSTRSFPIANIILVIPFVQHHFCLINKTKQRFHSQYKFKSDFQLNFSGTNRFIGYRTTKLCALQGTSDKDVTRRRLSVTFSVNHTKWRVCKAMLTWQFVIIAYKNEKKKLKLNNVLVFKNRQKIIIFLLRGRLEKIIWEFISEAVSVLRRKQTNKHNNVGGLTDFSRTTVALADTVCLKMLNYFMISISSSAHSKTIPIGMKTIIGITIMSTIKFTYNFCVEVELPVERCFCYDKHRTYTVYQMRITMSLHISPVKLALN